MKSQNEPLACKNFGKDSCPNRDNEALNELKYLGEHPAGCYPKLGGFMEKASAVCAGCKKFEYDKPNIILHP